MTGFAVGRDRRLAHVVLTGVGLVGIVALFLPFTAGTSAHEGLRHWDMWRLALPAYLSLIILPACARWIVSGTLSGLERMVGYVLAAASVILIFLSYLQLESWPDGPVRWIAVVLPALILGFGATILARTPRTGRPGAYRPILALQVVYIANAILALGLCFPNLQIGAYGILVTTTAYALQINLGRTVSDA